MVSQLLVSNHSYQSSHASHAVLLDRKCVPLGRVWAVCEILMMRLCGLREGQCADSGDRFSREEVAKLFRKSLFCSPLCTCSGLWIWFSLWIAHLQQVCDVSWHQMSMHHGGQLRSLGVHSLDGTFVFVERPGWAAATEDVEFTPVLDVGSYLALFGCSAAPSCV